MPRANRGCSEKRLLALQCKWQECDKTFAVPVNNYQEFSEHVFGHVNEYLSGMGFSQFAIANSLSATSENVDLALATPLVCSWSECNWEVRGSPDEFSRHILFHAYHIKLKCLGALAVISGGLRQCSFDVETSDLLPDVSEAFLCRWESCDAQFLCPDNFYRHVDSHGYAANKEDVLVATCDKANVGAAGSSEKEYEGQQLHKMTQFVCKWEGCTYLTNNPWKVKEHCRIHTGEKLVACPSCGLFFANKTKFADHLIRQDTAQYEHFQCSHCLKRCASERLLRDHMRQHVNHVRCPHCDMTCANPSSLRSHLKFKHSLDRPFKCSMCNFSCKTSCDLSRHEDIHFDKTFYCQTEGCSFECRNAPALRTHIRRVHQKADIRVYMCHICGKKLSRGCLLTKHLKKEHHFSWPSGHSRFLYKLDEDGFYRLQMVRFESAELTEQLSKENPDVHGNADSLEANESLNSSEIAEKSDQPVEQMSMAVDEGLLDVSCTHSIGTPKNEECIGTDSTDNVGNETVGVSLTDRYEALLRLYEMEKDNEATLVVPLEVENEDEFSDAEREAVLDLTNDDDGDFSEFKNKSRTVMARQSPKDSKLVDNLVFSQVQ